MWDRSELPPEPGVTYSAFVDPSGGVSDSLTLAIAHLGRERGLRPRRAARGAGRRSILSKRWRNAPTLLRRYGVAKIIGDKYAGEWPPARFAEHGIEFEQCARPKCDLYHDLLPLLNARRIELLNLPRLSAQLCGLERRTARSGKDSIDHAPGGHDDLANAVAGVLVGLDLDRRQPLIRLNDVFAADCEGAIVALTPAAPLRARVRGRRHGGRRRRGGLLRPRAVQAAALCPRRGGWAAVAGFLHRHHGAAQ